ncbi:MAG: hypothetical protein ACP5GZ_07040 [Vulcanisaeta sp.]|jgi:hypothetical protein|uniref:hypothetical protein n=1 Tax=Vulcanisaeta sp. TaxID=2020871 RepID=UPI003D0FA3C5
MEKDEIINFSIQETLRRINLIHSNQQCTDLSNVNPYKYIKSITVNSTLEINNILDYYKFLKNMFIYVRDYLINIVLPKIKVAIEGGNYLISPADFKERDKGYFYIEFPNIDKTRIIVLLNNAISPSITPELLFPTIAFNVRLNDNIRVSPRKARSFVIGILSSDGSSTSYNTLITINTAPELHALVSALVNAYARSKGFDATEFHFNINSASLTNDGRLNIRFILLFRGSYIGFYFKAKSEALNAWTNKKHAKELDIDQNFALIGHYSGDGIFTINKRSRARGVGFSISKDYAETFKNMLVQLGYEVIDRGKSGIFFKHNYARIFTVNTLRYILLLEDPRVIFITLNHPRIKKLAEMAFTYYNEMFRLKFIYNNYVFSLRHTNHYYIRVYRTRQSQLTDFMNKINDVASHLGVSLNMYLTNLNGKQPYLNLNIAKNSLINFISAACFIAQPIFEYGDVHTHEDTHDFFDASLNL